MLAVTETFRCPTCSPIRAHGTPPRWSRLIRRCLRSCGETGTPAVVQARVIAVRNRVPATRGRAARAVLRCPAEQHGPGTAAASEDARCDQTANRQGRDHLVRTLPPTDPARPTMGSRPRRRRQDPLQRPRTLPLQPIGRRTPRTRHAKAQTHTEGSARARRARRTQPEDTPSPHLPRRKLVLTRMVTGDAPDRVRSGAAGFTLYSLLWCKDGRDPHDTGGHTAERSLLVDSRVPACPCPACSAGPRLRRMVTGGMPRKRAHDPRMCQRLFFPPRIGAPPKNSLDQKSGGVSVGIV